MATNQDLIALPPAREGRWQGGTRRDSFVSGNLAQERWIEMGKERASIKRVSHGTCFLVHEKSPQHQTASGLASGKRFTLIDLAVSSTAARS